MNDATQRNTCVQCTTSIPYDSERYISFDENFRTRYRFCSLGCFRMHYRMKGKPHSVVKKTSLMDERR